MRKSILIPFIVFGFIILPENIFRQEIYESVDERGTINFSDSPASSVITTKEGAARQDGEEVLRGMEWQTCPDKRSINRSMREERSIFRIILPPRLLQRKKEPPNKMGQKY